LDKLEAVTLYRAALMSEPSNIPEVPPPDAPRTACINWHRVRVYLLSILVMGSMWAGATLIAIRLHPKSIVTDFLARLPFPSTVGRVIWLNRRTLEIDDVKIGGFFYADAVVITASPFGLWRHHLAQVQILGGQLFTKPLYAAMDKVGAGQSDGLDWVIGRLEISRGTVMLDNLVADTSIPVRLGVRFPIILSALRLGKPDSSPEMKQERTVEIGAVNIVSPVDPTVRVLSFPLTQIRFTYTELWHHHIRQINFVRPTLFLGEDLFWLSKQFKAENKTTAEGPSAPWKVAHLEVLFGQLAVNAFGQPVVQFPFFFGTKVDDIRLDQLDQISAKSVIAIERLDQDYPDYKVRIVNLKGKLYFSWPPSNANANNVVNTINIDELSWNNIPVKNVNTTVTFDPNGVFGKLSGVCEGGLLAGNFEFYYIKGFTWNANLFAQKIDCQPIAEKLAGKYVDLTGQLDGKLSVQGRVTEILNCSGALNLPNPGKLDIKSMDDLLDRIPSDMIKLKRDALKIGLLNINYTPAGGVSTLKLDGPRGQRQFSVYLHPYSSSDTAVDAAAEEVSR
jgi:hypothetical protein